MKLEPYEMLKNLLGHAEFICIYYDENNRLITSIGQDIDLGHLALTIKTLDIYLSERLSE